MNAKSKEFIEVLFPKAQEYIKHCRESEKEIATGSGKVVKIKERHIPTIAFFLNIWLPENLGETIVKDTYYRWLHDEDKDKSDAIKKVDELFKALATDIVANEQKGIFYAKNKLGMTDRLQQTNIQEQPLFGKTDE